MLPIAFTESLELKNRLNTIDTLRAQILCKPLSPKNDLKLRWEAQVTKIHCSLALANEPVSRGLVVRLLGNRTKHVANEYNVVLHYKQALDYIHETWTANPKPATIHTIVTLGEIMHIYPNAVERKVQESDGPIKATLEYLSTQSDHPVIQAGIALCLLTTSAPITGDPGYVARLVANVFLAKYGYNIRGLLTVEKNWLAASDSYDLALESLRREGNLNTWLLYYTQTIEENLRERLEDLDNPKVHLELPSDFWDMNERQKAILSYVSEPGSSITNKRVQSMFSVSQITASRDLTKLATLGLLSAHGKGRSVIYTNA